MSYKVHFDRIVNGVSENKQMELTEQKKRIEEHKQRQKEWDEKSQVVKGIPGRCVIIERGERNIWFSKEIIDLWESDQGSIMYYYDDIEFLSGSAGYVLKMSDGKMYRQVTMMS